MRFLRHRVYGRKQPLAGSRPSLGNIRSKTWTIRFEGGVMKKRILITAIFAGMIFLAASAASAQGGAKQGPDVTRDPEMEKDSLHNLETARLYFKLRKAYVASLNRCEEILAGNPTFAKIDEVLYMAGKSSMNLAEGKGKQASTQYVIREGEKK